MVVTVADIMMIAVSTTMVDAVVGLVFDGHLDGLDHLKRHFLGDVYGHLYGLDILEGFGDGDVLHDGNFDGDLDGVGLGDELDLGGDGGVGNLSVGLGMDHLGIAVDSVTVGVASMAGDAMATVMTVVTEAVGTVEVRHRQARHPKSNGAPRKEKG